MTQPSPANIISIAPAEMLIVALDLASADEARAVVSELRGRVGAFKVGLQLFTAAGPELVREIVGEGEKVFLDLKFHDIPNTVALASVEAARLGVWMFNVHASGGTEMMRRTAGDVHSFCDREGLSAPKIIAVTVLTSSDDDDLRSVGVERSLDLQVTSLAQMALEAGLDGVVASAREAGSIRQTVGDDGFLIVTPGIRPVSATLDDQKRVTTFAEALCGGSDYVVVGRPVTQASNRVQAVKELLGEIA